MLANIKSRARKNINSIEKLKSELKTTLTDIETMKTHKSL